MRLSGIFVLVAGISGLILSLFTPPLQTADEAAHFFRIYQLSEGNVGAKTFPLGAGGVLPASLERFAAQSLKRLPRHPERKTNATEVLSLINIPLQPDLRATLRFTGAVFYSPVPYLPQVAGVYIGRLFEAPPLLLLYSARVAALASFLGLVALSLKLYPPLQWAIFLLALMPMTLSLAASSSADTVTSGLAFLWTAMVLRLRDARCVLRRDILLMALLLSCLALCKQAYGLLGLLAVSIPASSFGSQERKWTALATIALVGVAAAYGWSNLVSDLATKPLYRGGRTVDAVAQINWIRAHPGDFVSVLTRGLWARRGTLLQGFVGNLGWADTPIRREWVAWELAMLMVAGLTIVVGRPMRIRERVLFGLTWLLVGLAISCLIYVTWVPTGQRLSGVQGRYFIPAALPALVAMAGFGGTMLTRYRAGLRAVLLVTGIASAFVTVGTTWSRFYGQ